MQRLAESAQMSEWLAKEGDFQLEQERVRAAIEEAVRTKTTFELEHRVRAVDGSVGWVLSHAVPILGSDGQIVEWFGAANDICKFFAAHARRPVGILDKLVLKDVLCDDSGRYQTAVLPADIFQGHHPVLRHLEIHHVVFKWDNPIICASLTTLVLRLFSSFNRSHTSTFEEVFQRLRRRLTSRISNCTTLFRGRPKTMK